MSLTDTIKGVLGTATVERLRDVRDRGAALISPMREEMLRRKLARQRLGLSDLGRFQSGVTLFFAPAAGVVPHFATHCILARTLQEMGHPVLLVGCFMSYPRCIVMDGNVDVRRVDRHPGLVCLRCGNISADFAQAYGLDTLDIGTLLRAEDQREIERIIAEAPADLTTLSVDGIAFGKIAGSAASTSKKTLDFAGHDPIVRKAILKQVHGALISYYSMRNLLGTIPVSRLVYFGEYAMHLGAAIAVQRAGIPITNMAHASSMSINRQRPTLPEEPVAILTYREMLRQWPLWRDLPLPPQRVDQMFDDILFRFTSDSAIIYSRKRSGDTNALFARLRLSDDKPVLVAFTSSLDEIFANRLMLDAMRAAPLSVRQPFEDQIAWLKCLIEHAESTGRFQLVIRIHPREGGNRREAHSSEHLALLRQHFDRQYRNTRIIWPGEDFSSYDLMEIADAGTSGWSSTVGEMARFGVPTVVAFDDYTPTPLGDVVDWSATPQGYLDLVEAALNGPASLARVTATMRWMHIKLFEHTVDLSDVVPTPDYETLPPYRRPVAAGIIEDVLIGGARILDLNRQALALTQHPDATAQERRAVLRNLRRAIWLFSTGTEPSGDYTLAHGAPASGELLAGVDAAAWRENGLVMFQTRDGIRARRSRLVESLVTMVSGAS